ncbi:uncharacterized protein LY89DRAFT_744072 [Mollisia scopiformis]|uniref:C3H1-type domain-containing protein n=1 Tax=Mollisia scopiformis TaxID=149040 RepID=A0A132B1B4_MOLSC|nr:uncharacterized protein LY89DRAFT_744072 [Mollisia scopiformis]KUJ06168.1 hypothetical protein LY89DRAFT_744072 [Mollisia scopiformis]
MDSLQMQKAVRPRISYKIAVVHQSLVHFINNHSVYQPLLFPLDYLSWQSLQLLHITAHIGDITLMTSPGTRWQGLNSGGRFDGGSSGRRGGSGWSGGGGGGGAEGSRRTLCRNIQQGGRCRLSAGCTFSHDLSNSNSHESPLQPRERLADTPEQQHTREDYNSWKRLIKTPPKRNDIGTIELLWNSALTILNADDRDWKQMLPRNLDDKRIMAVNIFRHS